MKVKLCRVFHVSTSEQFFREMLKYDEMFLTKVARFVKKKNLVTLNTAQCYFHFLLFYFSLCCSPTAETNRRLTVNEMYLVDSGGQYLWVKNTQAFFRYHFLSPAVEMTHVLAQRRHHWHHSDSPLGNTDSHAEGDIHAERIFMWTLNGAFK